MTMSPRSLSSVCQLQGPGSFSDRWIKTEEKRRKFLKMACSASHGFLVCRLAREFGAAKSRGCKILQKTASLGPLSLYVIVSSSSSSPPLPLSYPVSSRGLFLKGNPFFSLLSILDKNLTRQCRSQRNTYPWASARERCPSNREPIALLSRPSHGHLSRDTPSPPPFSSPFLSVSIVPTRFLAPHTFLCQPSRISTLSRSHCYVQTANCD